MEETENRLFDEPPAIKPEVDLRARWVFSELWKVDGRYLDQLADEILSRYRYDRPMTYFSSYRQNPITVHYRPNGSAQVETPSPLSEQSEVGDCIELCRLVVNDSDFWEIVDKVSGVAGCEVSVNMVVGNAPQYFTRGYHHFLTLNHAKSGTCLFVDPAFQKIGLGKGYTINPEEVVTVEPGRRYKNGGTVKLSAGRYTTVRDNYVFKGDFGVLVLGLDGCGLIVEWGVAVGESKLKPIFPIAKLVERDGRGRAYYYDPVKGIVDCVDKRSPRTEETVLLKRFFGIAKEIDFRFGND